MKKLLVFFFLLIMFTLPEHLAAQQAVSPATAELLRIAGNTDVQHVEQLLSQGADVNAHDHDGMTPLTTAAQMGDFATVELLLQHGAQINANPNGNGTALVYAVRGFDRNADMKLQVATAKVLLQHNADPQVPDGGGMTPLMIAAQEPEELQAVRWLLSHGAHVNAKDNRGMTALQYARGDKPIMKLLRAHGAR